jgi:hypothetical protein
MAWKKLISRPFKAFVRWVRWLNKRRYSALVLSDYELNMSANAFIRKMEYPFGSEPYLNYDRKELSHARKSNAYFHYYIRGKRRVRRS